MTVTISRLYNNYDDARAAVRNLEAAGVGHNDISILASNADNWYSDDRKDGTYPDRDLDGKDDRAEAAGGGRRGRRCCGRRCRLAHRAWSHGYPRSWPGGGCRMVGLHFGGRRSRGCDRRRIGRTYAGWSQQRRCRGLCRGTSARRRGCERAGIRRGRRSSAGRHGSLGGENRRTKCSVSPGRMEVVRSECHALHGGSNPQRA